MMMAEENRGGTGRGGGSRDQFPVGMRVLAVDDDPTCLKLLETLLRRCQYHVTTTNQAIKALKMLRENKDNFDLVISDVHMPDMDGFKLLELVGLEMDLPVIMLSGNGETKTVMKGITHGAVDYLLKPIRIEALRNIWQHVIRKKKVDRRDHTNLNSGEEFVKPQNVNFAGGQPAGSTGSTELNGNLNRKRKDQIEEDEDGCEENESEDPSSQKKSRVVWSVELHRKFVAAVNQLGVDKAVPKRILDLMNVERLTRENVASHLQKYRLYLKRLSAVAIQQANMVAALGGRDMSYLPYSVDGFGNFHALAASGQSPALSSYQPNGVLNLASPNESGLEGLARSGVVHFGPTHDTTSPLVNDFNKLQHISLPGNQHANLLEGMHMPWELEKLQQQTRMLPTNELPSSLCRSDAATGRSMNSFINVTDSPLLLQAQQRHKISGGLINNSSLTMRSVITDPFERDARVPSFSPDFGRCNETWQGVAPLSVCTTNTSTMTIPSTRDDVALRMMEAYASPQASQINSNSFSLPPNCVAVASQHDPAVGRDMMLTSSTGEEHFLNFRSRGNSRQKLEEPRTDHASGHNFVLGSSINHPLSNQPLLDPISENQRLNVGLYNQNMDTSMMGQTNFSAPLYTQSCKIDKSISDGQQMYKDQHNFATSKLTGGLSSNGCNFDDLMNAMIKTGLVATEVARLSFSWDINSFLEFCLLEVQPTSPTLPSHTQHDHPTYVRPSSTAIDVHALYPSLRDSCG